MKYYVFRTGSHVFNEFFFLKLDLEVSIQYSNDLIYVIYVNLQ